jgi:thiol:disulfide interchange protein DsbD
VLLLIGAASGAEDPLRPLQNFSSGSGGIVVSTGVAGERVASGHGGLQWRPVRNLEELQSNLAAAGGKPVLLDLYADWCISCKVMEREVFPEPAVANRLSQFHLVRADVTKNNAEDKALLNAFGLFGPPSLVFFTTDGREISEVRVQGEIGADALAAHLGAVLKRYGEDNFGELAANFREK